MTANSVNSIRVAILTFPGVMHTAVAGLSELFQLANRIAEQEGTARFEVTLLDTADIGEDAEQRWQILILPPCIEGSYYETEQPKLSAWLRQQHAAGALLCSVCAGAFILAHTGLLDQRSATTHWMLAERFAQQFPQVTLDANKILINDGDLITAGRLMAWMDLGLELVAQFGQPAQMRLLGAQLVVDTAPREQRYYRRFMPTLDHGDAMILKTQHRLQRDFQLPISVREMAEQIHLTERTFLRRFVKATGLKPKAYLQQLRIGKACEMLESTPVTVEQVAAAVGYEDTSAFRKTFIKVTGLTPRAFRSRFSHNNGEIDQREIR